MRSSSIGCLAAALNQAGDLFTLATTQNQAMPHQDQAGRASKQPRQKRRNVISETNLALKISLHAVGEVWQAADKKGTICGGASCASGAPGASGDPGGSGRIRCLPSLNSPHMKRSPKSKLLPYH